MAIRDYQYGQNMYGQFLYGGYLYISEVANIGFPFAVNANLILKSGHRLFTATISFVNTVHADGIERVGKYQFYAAINFAMGLNTDPTQLYMGRPWELETCNAGGWNTVGCNHG